MASFRQKWFFKEWKIAALEYGLHFVDNELVEILKPGTHRFWDRENRHIVQTVSTTDPWIVDPNFEKYVLTGKLDEYVETLQVGDTQRGLVFVDGRYSRTIGPGRYSYWKNSPKTVKVDLLDVESPRFEHPLLSYILTSSYSVHLESFTVAPNTIGLLYYDERYVETLSSGTYAFWKGFEKVRIEYYSLREQLVEIIGQEIMTADKVTLRINAGFSYRIVDALTMSRNVDNIQAFLYREAQMVLREMIGRRELEAFLSDRNEIGEEADKMFKAKTESLGVVVSSLGIRDVILPGEMKEMLNKVTAAKKAAEANLILRREETAAMRSQANTAKLLENNPTLMRLREMEVLEKIVASGNLQVILGEKGLTERIVNML